MISYKSPRMQPYLGLSSLFKSLVNTLGPVSHGRRVEAFNAAFKQFFDSKEAHAVSRARFAFYYLLKAMDLPKGSQVLITSLHITDFINMILLLDLEPVFVDMNPKTYNIDQEDLKRKISNKSKVLLVTHLCGLVTEMDAITAICAENRIELLEDCSQCVGADYKEKSIGTFGKAGIFSLSFMKTLSTLYGGMIISDDVVLMERVRKLTADLPLPPRSFLLGAIIKSFSKLPPHRGSSR